MRWHEDKLGGVHILLKFMREIERRRENGWAFGGGHFKPNRMRRRERASSTKALCVSQFSSSIMILSPKKWILDNITLSFWYRWKKKNKTQWKKSEFSLFFFFCLSSFDVLMSTSSQRWLVNASADGSGLFEVGMGRAQKAQQRQTANWYGPSNPTESFFNRQIRVALTQLSLPSRLQQTINFKSISFSKIRGFNVVKIEFLAL